MLQFCKTQFNFQKTVLFINSNGVNVVTSVQRKAQKCNGGVLTLEKAGWTAVTSATEEGEGRDFQQA